MFVEFLGLPASGKTTIRTALTSALAADGSKIVPLEKLDAMDTALPGYIRRNALPRAIYRLDEFSTKHPEFTRLIDLIGEQSPSHKALLLSVCARYQILQSVPGICDYAITDEGMLHRAIHLMTHHSDNSESMLDAFCDAMPQTATVILLDLSAACCIERATARLSARAKGTQTPVAISRRIKRAHGDMTTLTKRRDLMLRAAARVDDHGIKVIQADATAPVATTVSKIKAALSR